MQFLIGTKYVREAAVSFCYVPNSLLSCCIVWILAVKYVCGLPVAVGTFSVAPNKSSATQLRLYRGFLMLQTFQANPLDQAPYASIALNKKTTSTQHLKKLT
jgi:hypothetical protein